MAQGPGKYDETVRLIAAGTGADVAFLLIVGGREGSGSALAVTNLVVAKTLPALLREIADEVEKDLRRAAGN